MVEDEKSATAGSKIIEGKNYEGKPQSNKTIEEPEVLVSKEKEGEDDIEKHSSSRKSSEVFFDEKNPFQSKVKIQNDRSRRGSTAIMHKNNDHFKETPPMEGSQGIQTRSHREIELKDTEKEPIKKENAHGAGATVQEKDLRDNVPLENNEEGPKKPFVPAPRKIVPMQNRPAGAIGSNGPQPPKPRVFRPNLILKNQIKSTENQQNA
jgi:hypothetical protein